MNLNFWVATILEAMLIVAGAGEIEELTEDEVQRFGYYAEHPLQINSADVRDLESSGLFSTFRAASLFDYISRNGAVLSVQELAAVDGFDWTMAEALSHFVSFAGAEDGSGHWTTDSQFQTSLTAKGLEGDGQTTVGWLSSAKLQKGTVFSLNAGAAGLYEHRTASDACSLAAFTLSCGLSLPKAHLKCFFGDFNARFAQGMALWNTLRIESATSVNSLVFRPTGLSVSQSSKGSYAKTGIGFSWTCGRLGVSAALDLPGFKSAVIAGSSSGKRAAAGFEPVLNLNWWGRFCTFGLTSVTSILSGASGPEISSVLSADFRTCISGADIAGEAALTFTPGVPDSCAPAPSVRLSCAAPLGEWFKTGLSLTYTQKKHMARLIAEADCPKGHHFAVGALFSNNRINASARIDATALFNWADFVKWEIRLKDNFTFGLPEKQALTCRTDLSAKWDGHWTTTVTSACSRTSQWGLAIYLEQSYLSESILSAHLRAGIFSIDDWNGRIYFYEYDIPGRFTVPALYGRGYWISAHLRACIARHFKCALRVSYKDYVLMQPQVRKPSVLEARLSLTANF